MPITFKSQATGDLVMLDRHAEALLQRLGKTAKAAGTLTAAEMPQALVVLRAIEDPLEAIKTTHAGKAATRDESGDADDAIAPTLSFQDEPVSLRQRAVPLIRLIEQALAESKPIVWGV